MASRVYVFLAMSIVLNALVACSDRKTYLVHMKDYMKPASYASAADWYVHHFTSVTSSDGGAILYTYDTVFHGYAAVVTPEELDALRRSDVVLGVYENSMYQLHTRRTLQFDEHEGELGFWGAESENEIQLKSQNVIIGVVDTGVWPESKSFSDAGMLPVPQRWRGQCEKANDFDPKTNCNKKLIGARVFYKGYEADTGATVRHSPRDYEGHGTHTSSTAAGAYVPEASFFGLANGTARGMATRARIAMYKVCFEEGCNSADIIAAMNVAISDGVNVFSLSLGGSPQPYYSDAIAIAAFQANQLGITVVCSAGNSGPSAGSVSNTAPWITTVAASTVDRTFPATVKLGNGAVYTGISLYTGEKMGNQLVGLVYPTASPFCLSGSLNPTTVKGKLVVCNAGNSSPGQKANEVKRAGGVGVIVANNPGTGRVVQAYPYMEPGLSVGELEGCAIRQYAGTSNPTAVLSFGGTATNVKPAPAVAGFSSRGPNRVTPQILKPDITAPGVNILAAWTEAVGPSDLPSDRRISAYNIISGTSMSCPHVSGVSALLTAIHPEWSPSAIRSALVTTAYTVDNTNSAIQDAATNSGLATPYAIGAGHIQPEKAAHPGLVYDATPRDYLALICSLGYSDNQVAAIAQKSNACANIQKLRDPGQFNYPSFSVIFNPSREVSYTRTLTNVEIGEFTYRVEVAAPSFVTVKVIPDTVKFFSKGEKRQYTVTFKVSGTNLPSSAFGSITWKSVTQTVRSPVAFTIA